MKPIDLKDEVQLYAHSEAKYDLLCNLADAIELEDGIFQWTEVETQDKFNPKGFKNFLWLGVACLCFMVALLVF